ncbi:hypothetical protein CFOL_v3_11040, partial [Cephalotus follicularis]
CKFHRDHGHDTEACCQLTYEIETLIQRGHLRAYVANESRKDEKKPRRSTNRGAGNQQPTTGVIQTIFGGFAGGVTSSSRKAYVTTMVRPDNRPRTNQVITFTDADYDGVQTPHDDAMVVTLTVTNFEDKRVLIDNGSSANIMFYDIFEKMKLGTSRLKPIDSHLYGFSGERVHVEGTIELPSTVGIAPRQSTIMVRFLIVKLPSTYNVIIGCPEFELSRSSGVYTTS